ncbi:MAG TPA: flagellin [Gemmatimonadaceae bacterium]|nr:flagellin [Gemmatimonadaceae bacterium]
MRINTNISALNAYRNLTQTNNAVSSSMEKLSSGFRINRAADDAAGLGIANKLRGDIRAMNQASRNTEQANSVLQIAEGATSSIQQMLERMKELATQAGSDSVDAAGRGRINAEFTALRDEITRTVATTKFQGSALLDGTFGDPGATLEAADITGLDASAAAGTYALSVDSSTGALTVTGPSSFSQTVNLADATFASGTLSFDVTGLGTIAVAADSATDVASVVAGLDGRGFDITAGTAGSAATAATATSSATATPGDYTSTTKAFDITIDGATQTITLDGNYATVADMVTAINGKLDTAFGGTSDVQVAEGTGADAGKLVWTQTSTGSTHSFSVTDTDGVVGGDIANTAGTDAVAATSPSVTADSITGNPAGEQASFLVGTSGAYDTDDLIKLDAIDLSVASLGIDTADLSTADGARSALTSIDTAMDTVNETLGDIGASQNRIGYAMSNLKTSIQNFTAAESVIRDVDMAEEMTKFSKNNILAQAGTAMLAQANQSAQGVLQLLRG